MKRFYTLMMIALMGLSTMSCTSKPKFEATELAVGGKILIENAKSDAELSIKTDGNFKLEKADGNYYLRSTGMGEAYVELSYADGKTTGDTISSWGVQLNNEGLDYQGVKYNYNYAAIVENSYTDFSAVNGNIIIPRYLVQNGKSKDLTTILANAFYGNQGIYSLSFAKGSQITSIPSTAFIYCSQIRDVDLSNCTKLTTIAEEAFKSCGRMERVNFSGCTELKTIKNNAFDNCQSIMELDFSHNTKLESIGASAFTYCSDLKLVNLTNCMELKTIGKAAFLGILKMDAAVISNGDVDIDSYIFSSNFRFSIYGTPNSKLQTYAKEHNYKFKDIADWGK